MILALFAGYVVYGDGVVLQEVPDSMADSAVVRLVGRPAPASLTVRTKSGDKLSAESAVCPVPVSARLAPTTAAEQDSDSDSELMEKLAAHPVVAGPPRPRELVINYNSAYPDIDSDIGPSELSDIAEEPEDELSEEESNAATPQPHRNSTAAPYSVPVANALNVWKATKPSSESSQVSNSQFETQKFATASATTATPTNNNNVKNNVNPELGTRGNDNSKLGETNGNSSSTAVVNNRTERMRIFVALFDYDPPSMSPNPDACEEELPFREGQLIKVRECPAYTLHGFVQSVDNFTHAGS